MELDGEKKPKAKSPPSDMMAEPGESSLPGTSRVVGSTQGQQEEESSDADGNGSHGRKASCNAN